MKHFIRGMLFLFIDIIVMMPTAIDVPFITPACHYVHTARVCVSIFPSGQLSQYSFQLNTSIEKPS